MEEDDGRETSDDDDDDVHSISTAVPHELERVEEEEGSNGRGRAQGT